MQARYLDEITRSRACTLAVLAKRDKERTGGTFGFYKCGFALRIVWQNKQSESGQTKRDEPRDFPKSKYGPRRDRTAGLVIANDALYQLSYGPVTCGSLAHQLAKIEEAQIAPHSGRFQLPPLPIHLRPRRESVRVLPRSIQHKCSGNKELTRFIGRTQAARFIWKLG